MVSFFSKGLNQIMFYLGIDVSKATLHTCLLLGDEGKCKTKVVENTPPGIAALLAWATRQGVACDQLHVVMEATGVYHESAAQVLFNAGVRLSIPLKPRTLPEAWLFVPKPMAWTVSSWPALAPY